MDNIVSPDIPDNNSNISTDISDYSDYSDCSDYGDYSDDKNEYHSIILTYDDNKIKDFLISSSLIDYYKLNINND